MGWLQSMTNAALVHLVPAHMKQTLRSCSSQPVAFLISFLPAGQHRAQLLDSVLKLLPPRMAKWMLGKFTDPGGGSSTDVLAGTGLQLLAACTCMGSVCWHLAWCWGVCVCAAVLCAPCGSDIRDSPGGNAELGCQQQ